MTILVAGFHPVDGLSPVASYFHTLVEVKVFESRGTALNHDSNAVYNVGLIINDQDPPLGRLAVANCREQVLLNLSVGQMRPNVEWEKVGLIRFGP